MPLHIKGPYCFGCGGSKVVRRYFWSAVAWLSSGPVEGSVEHAVCLDCTGDIGSKQPLTRKPETHNVKGKRPAP